MLTQQDSDDPVAEPLLTPKEVAALLRVSVRKVHTLAIKSIALGPRTVRYRRRDVRDHLNGDKPDQGQ